MCHRYGIRSNPETIAIALYPGLLDRMPPSFWTLKDFYPLAEVPVIRTNENDEWEMVPMQWGLLPFWWKPGQNSHTSFQRKTFNARSETIHEKPTFRAAFKTRRCLIPASEFYEGTTGNAAFFQLDGEEVMAFAGLWESCQFDDKTIESCTIVTTNANDRVAEYHPRKRMPVILPDQSSRELWMSADIVEREPLEELFHPLPSSRISHREIESMK